MLANRIFPRFSDVDYQYCNQYILDDHVGSATYWYVPFLLISLESDTIRT